MLCSGKGLPLSFLMTLNKADDDDELSCLAEIISKQLNIWVVASLSLLLLRLIDNSKQMKIRSLVRKTMNKKDEHI